MQVVFKLITLALVGATAGVHAHELRGGTAVLADVAAAATEKKVLADVAVAGWWGASGTWYDDDDATDDDDDLVNDGHAAAAASEKKVLADVAVAGWWGASGTWYDDDDDWSHDGHAAAAATGKGLDFFPPEEMRVEGSDDDDDRNMNAASKRQAQRDERRSFENPDRTAGEEQRERERTNTYRTDDDGPFFPTEEMDEVSEDRSQKTSSAQKRQMQRDERRKYDNPDRSQDEEQRERERKTNQSQRRGNGAVDPADPNYGNSDFPRNREDTRQRGCNESGRGCNHHRVNPSNEPNSRRREADQNCIYNCGGSVDCERRCSELKTSRM